MLLNVSALTSYSGVELKIDYLLYITVFLKHCEGEALSIMLIFPRTLLKT